MPVACQSRAGTEPAGETQSLLLRPSKTTEMKCFGGFFYSQKEGKPSHLFWLSVWLPFRLIGQSDFLAIFFLPADVFQQQAQGNFGLYIHHIPTILIG